MAKDINWHFTEEECEMTSDNVKKILKLSGIHDYEVEDAHVFHHSSPTSRFAAWRNVHR